MTQSPNDPHAARGRSAKPTAVEAGTATVLVDDRQGACMVAFELRDVAGGWDTAALGPSDHVEFAVYEDDTPVVHTYGSFHQLLRLYDCATHERTTHPQFLGYDLTERGDRVRIDLHGGNHVDTTYVDLQAALDAFLGDVFDALDAHPTHGSREDHLATIAEHDVALVDVDALYDDLADGDA
jgi:hypothetical protein